MKKLSQFGSVSWMVLAGSALLSAQSVNRKGVVSIIADFQIEHTNVTANGPGPSQTLDGHYYRDEYGRSRLEQGGTITINDPVNRVTITLDLTQRIARKVEHPAPAQTRTPSSSVPSQGSGAKTTTELGTQKIDGIEVVGQRFVNMVPVTMFTGSGKPIEQTTEVWVSIELQLPILVTVSDAVSGKTTVRYKNIQRDVEMDPQLFDVPAGFQVVLGTPGAFRPVQAPGMPATKP